MKRVGRCPPMRTLLALLLIAIAAAAASFSQPSQGPRLALPYWRAWQLVPYSEGMQKAVKWVEVRLQCARMQSAAEQQQRQLSAN